MFDYLGKTLLDNTTIYGAAKAYRDWPPTSNDWLADPNALNLRSLMDVLEAIVLYDRIIIDGTSRIIVGERNVFEDVWDDLIEKKDEQGDHICSQFAFGVINRGKFVTSVVETSFAKLIQYLADGTFVEASRQFAREGIDFLVPVFYRGPGEFRDLFLESFPNDLTDIAEPLKAVERALAHASPTAANYAMFAFRGFYYYELARLLRISYSPHTWRSNLIDIDTDKHVMDFAKHTLQASAQIRQQFAQSLNTEFSTESFTVEVPVIATYIAHQCSNRHQLLEVALQVRRSQAATAFRRWVSEIQAKVRDQSNLRQIAEAKSELNRTISEIRQELSLNDDQSPEKQPAEKVKIKLGLPIASVASVEIPISVPLTAPDWIQNINRQRSHLVFLREITKRSVSLSPFAHRYARLGP